MAYPRYQAARAFKFFTRTAGNLTLNSTAWADLPTIAATWDAVLAAQVGDVIECSVSAVWGGEVVYGSLDVVTMVSSAPVNAFGGSATSGSLGSGVGAWQGPPSVNDGSGGPVLRTMVGADLSAGTVTLRLRYRTSTATNKTLFASADNSFQFYAKNLGPADPN
jgi:hypothetical protein